MTSKGVSVLKFVGTVSLGLLTVRCRLSSAAFDCVAWPVSGSPTPVTPLFQSPSTSPHRRLGPRKPASAVVVNRHRIADNQQGLSYSLSTVTVPSILSLPSASDAVRAFQNLYPSATTRLRVLTGVSATSFLLAFFLSPRAFRHPYLVYSSVLCLTSGFAEQIAPYVLKGSPENSSEAVAARRQARREREEARKAARIARQEARMEASYEVLGDSHSDAATSDSEAAAAAAAEEEILNGEEVRGEVEGFKRTQIVQTAIASVGFLMSVIGIWGDGAIQVFQTQTVIVGV